MKGPVDPVGFRQSLLQILEANPPNEERLIAQFESRRNKGQPVYSSLIYLLSHLSFSEAEGRRHWERIAAHRKTLKARLGRDVGLRVALLDYFVNLNRELKNPKVIEISIYERTERSAVTDGLTGLYNHAYFQPALKREVLRSRRHELKVSLVMFDLDNFKGLNDSRGHVEGDRVLVKIAGLIRDSLREIDIAARYGGEEFALILPETSRTGAYVVAERIRRRIEGHFRRRLGYPVTISGGVATYPDDAQTPEDLLLRADEGLYRAKAAGKNRITLIQGERRRHVRIPTSQPLGLTLRKGLATSARTKNMSEGGLLMTVREPVPVGSRVGVTLRPGNGSTVGLRGEVVRVERVPNRKRPLYDVGVRLLTARSQGRAVRILRDLGTPAVAHG